MTLWDSQSHADAYEKSGLFRELLEEAKPFLSSSSEWKIQLTEDFSLDYQPTPEEPVENVPSDATPEDPVENVPPEASAEKPASDVTNMAMLAHLLGALFGFLGPLIIWLVKKDDHPFVAEQSKEALNFQLTLLIWYAGATVIVFASCGILFFAPLIPWLMQIILGIVGAVAAIRTSFKLMQLPGRLLAWEPLISAAHPLRL